MRVRRVRWVLSIACPLVGLTTFCRPPSSDQNPFPPRVVIPSTIPTVNQITTDHTMHPHTSSPTVIPSSMPPHPASSLPLSNHATSKPSSRHHDPIQLLPQPPLMHSPAPPTSSRKTPNVYINGLPPHFSEDHLFALTAPFGSVRSVRSFTRFVGERSSGYGFVLWVVYPYVLSFITDFVVT